MPDVSDLVQISITEQTSPATRSSFGTLLCVGDSAKLPDKDVSTLTIDAAFVTGNTINGKIDGVAITPVPFNTDSDTTMADLCTEIASFAQVATCVASDVGAVGYDNTATATATNVDTAVQFTEFVVTGGASQPTFTIVRTPFRRTQSYTTLSGLTDDVFATSDPEYTMATAFFGNKNPGTLKIGRKDSAENWDAAMTAIVVQDNDWYFFAATTKTIAQVTSLMDWANTESSSTGNDNPKQFWASSNDINNLSAAATSDIGYHANNSEYNESGVCYLEGANTTYPEAALLAEFATYDPGTVTLMFKQTPAFTASPSLSTAQRAAAFGKKVNLYETYGDSDRWRAGTMGSGQFADVRRDIDWFKATLATNIFTKLSAGAKVPYTNAGIGIVEAEVRGLLDEGIRVGMLRADPDSYDGLPYRVTVLDVGDISATDRANRLLPGTAITFEAKLAGAIHTVTISGTIAV